MDHNGSANPTSGLPFSDFRGYGTQRDEISSALGYRPSGPEPGATSPEWHRQTPPPAGSVSNTGLHAVQAEESDQDVLMDDPSARPGQGPPSPARGVTTNHDLDSMDVDPPRTTPERRPPNRKPLIQVATLNVRGLGARRREDRNKLQLAIRWMRAEKVGVLALQETYDCTDAFAGAERSNGKVWAFPNPGAYNARGTGFLVHRDSMPGDLRKEDFTHEVLVEGRLDTLSWRWGETTVTIANLYAPNAPQVAEAFFKDTAELLRGKDVSMVLGDWNHVESEMDRLPRSGSTKAVVSAIQDLKRVVGVEDSWREENPTDHEYTWEGANPGSSGHTSRSRLDRILLSDDMAARSTEHVIDVGFTVSDHYPVRVKIIDDESPDIGRGRWKMNLEDLEDEHAMEKCRQILLKCERQLNRRPMDAWLETKRAIQRVLTDRQLLRRRERSKLLSQLETRRATLVKRKDAAMNSGLIAEESNLRERIAAIKRGKMDRAAESSAARFAEKGEAVNKHWFNIGKSIRESSVIKALTDDDGDIARETEAMAEIARKHHERLQATPAWSPERDAACHRMESTTTGKRFSSEARAELESRISESEVEEVIRSSQTGKSPGKDGIPYEFYKYWLARPAKKEPDGPDEPDICKILARVWNGIAEGHVPPKEYVEGLMFLLYKKKRRDRVENYRPITLLGCDYKLQTKVLSNRLGRNVAGVLHPDQAGFVPGRDILDHVKLAKHVKELCDTTGRDGVLIALDQEKAYDRIDHAYLWGMLKAFQMPRSFIDTIRRLYEKAETSVLVNQTASKPFRVRRGVRQGGPLSCLLFNLAIEPLAESLRRSNLKGISIPNVIDRLIVRLFADDTQIYLSQFDRWTKVKAITDEWCLASTAKFNSEKTEVLPMGTATYRKDVCKWRNIRPERIRTAETVPRGARMVSDGQPLRILGGIVGHKVDEDQVWEPVVAKIEKLADKWSNRHMTLRGRRLIVSFLMQSKAQYMLSTNDPPKSVIDRVSKASHKVMWAGKKRGRTTMEVVERPIEEGGFGVPNFALRAKAARVMSGKKWCATDDKRPLWADVVDEMIRLSSARANDERVSSLLHQTWREGRSSKSSLPRDIRAMLKELRDHDLRVEALRLGAEAKGETPVWLSKSTNLSLKDENSAAMRSLRRKHHVVSMGDLGRITRTTQDGCKTHAACSEAADRILSGTEPSRNVRFATPFLEGEDGPDGLSFTHRRAEKAKENMIAGEAVTLDPSIRHKGGLRSALRIFGSPLATDRVPAYRTGPGRSTAPPLGVWTDGSTTGFGKRDQKVGFGIWTEDGSIRLASKLTSEPVTNNRAELLAVVVALEMAPRNTDVVIHTDSQYVVTGLTSTTSTWEDRGWLGVTNADAWKKAWHLIRSRTAETSVEKVAAHTGVRGNEEADALAKAGANGEEEHAVDLSVPHGWQLEGAATHSLSYADAYRWIRMKTVKSKDTRSPTNVERVLEELLETHDVRTTEAKLWRSLREPYIRREISDFLWLMIHGRSQCGTMFSKWGPGWEELQYCDYCGAVESMEHILTQCEDAVWRINLWREAATLLRKSGRIPRELCRAPSFAEIMGVGAVRLPNRVATRLWATIVSETAFTVWKLRNRRRFDEVRIPTRMAIDLWLTGLEKRAKTDLAVARLKGPKTATETQRATDAAAVWEGIVSFSGGITVWNYADHG